MAVLEKGSRLLYYEIRREEIKKILQLASFLFGKEMTAKVSGTFEDIGGELVFLSHDFYTVDIARSLQYRKFLAVTFCENTELLVIPERTTALLIELGEK